MRALQKNDALNYEYTFSALTLLIGWQEGHPACKTSHQNSLAMVVDIGGVQAVVPYGNPTYLSMQQRGNRLTQAQLENGH